MFLFKLDGEKNLRGTRFNPPFSLVFGHETKGLDSDLDRYGSTIKIEQTQETDSLNLAVSASVAMYKAADKNKLKK
jgi:tRNA G18 (ribose-2'-O)-methylase SpoU